MKETQQIELKESWRDEYLKTVSAFANTDGGTLYIGVADNGSVCGVQNAKKMLEDLPNKIVNMLGITSSVVLQEIENKDVISITVSKANIPISFQSKFYIRSGSTTQELKGTELQQYILNSNNITWDEVIMPDMDFDDIDRETAARFVRRGIEYNRLPATTDANNLPVLLDNLNLTNKKGELTRAAILLFGKRTQRYFSQVHFKIGRFAGADPTALLVQDDIEGNIFDMPEKVIELLKAKYLPSFISYAGLQRIEKLEIPEKAMREAILNAIIHRDYSNTSSIFMRIYDKTISIWNYGALPPQLSVEQLKLEHSSFPRNRLIANTFFRAGYVETWGRGIQNIVDYLKEENIPAPVFKTDEYSFTMTFDRNDNDTISTQVEQSKISDNQDENNDFTQIPAQVSTKSAPSRHQVGTKSAPSRHQVEIISMCEEDRTLVEIMTPTGRTDRTKFRNQILNPMLKFGLLEMTIPDKPNSRLQKYRLTEKGLELKNKLQKNV